MRLLWLADAYPSESTRAELSEKIGHTDRQIQMWFCHRRLKDHKVEPNKRVKLEEESNVVVQASSSYSSSGQTRRVVYEAPPAAPPQLSAKELRIIAMVEAQIGQPLREDGLVLGVEFEPLPPGAFGAPIGIAFVFLYFSIHVVSLHVTVLHVVCLTSIVSLLMSDN